MRDSSEKGAEMRDEELPFPDPVEDDLDRYTFLGNCPPTPPLSQH